MVDIEGNHFGLCIKAKTNIPTNNIQHCDGTQPAALCL